ncbi:hypothetical protein V6N13_116316 [Hibiscus sabdariffa]
MRLGRVTESKQPHRSAQEGKPRHKQKTCMPRKKNACRTRKKPRVVPGQASKETRNDEQPSCGMGSRSRRPSAPSRAQWENKANSCTNKRANLLSCG